MAKRVKKSSGKDPRVVVTVRDANGKIISSTSTPEREPERVWAGWSKRPLYV